MTKRELLKLVPADWFTQVARLKGYTPSPQEYEQIFDDMILSRMEPEALAALMAGSN